MTLVDMYEFKTGFTFCEQAIANEFGTIRGSCQRRWKGWSNNKPGKNIELLLDLTILAYRLHLEKASSTTGDYINDHLVEFTFQYSASQMEKLHPMYNISKAFSHMSSNPSLHKKNLFFQSTRSAVCPKSAGRTGLERIS